MKQARVVEEHKTNYVIRDGETEFLATVRGSFFADGQFPKVGDFVEYTLVSEDGNAAIESIVPRQSAIVRKAVETGDEQVIVTNVDIIFIVVGLDGDFNVSRIERYLLLARQSEVEPVVVLNKADSVDNPDEFVAQVQEVVGDVPVHAVSALSGEGMEVLLQYFKAETTAVLLGSSGAGKSTITNWLLEEDKQAIRGVREDDSRGRHTTTHRQLFVLPDRGYLIDTPGMRELGVFSTEEDEDEVFAELELLAHECKFSNCDHDKSDGCAIKAALEAGDITERQLKNYLKIQKEREFEESKHNPELTRERKQKQKDMFKDYRRTQRKNRSRKFY